MADVNKSKGIINSINQDNVNGARKALLEELFNDFSNNRSDIYKINFMRGIFFGIGSVLGATIFFTTSLWMLNLFTGWFPATTDYLNELDQAIRAASGK